MHRVISPGMPAPVKTLGFPTSRRSPTAAASRTKTEIRLTFIRKILRAIDESLSSLVPWGKTSMRPDSMSLTSELRASNGGSRDWRTMHSTFFCSSMRS